LAGSHGLPPGEECGCPPTCPAKPWSPLAPPKAGKLQRSREALDRYLVRHSFSEDGSFSGGGWRPSSVPQVAGLRRMERRTGASAGYAVLEVPRTPARGAPLGPLFSRIKLQTPVWRWSGSPEGSSRFRLVAQRSPQLLLGECHLAGYFHAGF